jgi:hypothetical protein
MTIAEQHLAQIGFGRDRAEPACWRVARIVPAVRARTAADPVDPAWSRELLRWRDRLAGDPRPSPYRIARV